jgi:hypothetical protein
MIIYTQDAKDFLQGAIRVPPAVQGTLKLLDERGHTVHVRRTRGGSLRYTLDNERERTALALSNRLRRLHGVG